MIQSSSTATSAPRRLILGLALAGLACLGASATLQAQGPGFGRPPHGPMGGPGHHGGPGGFLGGGEADPERMADRIDFGVRWALRKVDASEEQKDRISDIFQKAAADLRSIHEERKTEREAMRKAMVALDRSKVEALRQASIGRADQASKRLTEAFLEAGSLLTEAQRQQLADALEQRRHEGAREWGRR